MTQAGIEPATFRFVAQHLNHCATAVPLLVAWTKLKFDFDNFNRPQISSRLIL